MLQGGEEETLHIKFFKITAFQGLHCYAMKYAM